MQSSFDRKTRSTRRAAVCTLLVAAVIAAFAPARAEAESFVPTWKLLKGDEKRQFVAGYMYGWRDAAKVIDIARDFVRENPRDAVSGLEKIKTVYDLSGLKVDTVVRDLDSYFSDPSNRDASFSQAITSIRNK